MKKNFFRKMRYGFGEFFGIALLTFLVLIFRALPSKFLIFIGKTISILAFYLFKRYRERVIENLTIAFGKEKDPNEIKNLTKEVFFHLTLTTLETIYLIALPFGKLILNIEIKGKHYLDEALRQGNGVIALGAHLGSFTLLGTRLAAEGYPFNVIINGANFPRFMRTLVTYQRRVGQRFFSPKPITASVKKSLNCLYRNEILYILADEHHRRGGILTSFFGQAALTSPGAAILSLKTGAPILPMFILREAKIPRILIIYQPIEIKKTSNFFSDIKILTEKFTKTIEETIRQYPTQWAWLNRRWKLPGRNA